MQIRSISPREEKSRQHAGVSRIEENSIRRQDIKDQRMHHLAMKMKLEDDLKRINAQLARLDEEARESEA